MISILVEENKDDVAPGDIMWIDGKTQISTKEGGLFDLSSNDDVIIAGIFDRLKNRRRERYI